MSTTIDQKVVEMRFDNKHFEDNVQTSLKSIDSLKQKLNMDGATKGLENIDSAAKKVNMSGLGSAVEAVQAKFSALQVIGITALSNITNSAVNAGKRIVSALTIDPIRSGFSEYETQINAVQTILANTESKGKTITDVNKALDELNLYADKTIYNFTEMTRNIGTFTAAGVDLDTSVSAIKGIANLAAVSGSNSQQASTAMYQLSQALASGTVKLMDWNSVVNAGMGGQVFQDALKETARVHGIAIDEMIEEEGSFRETLSNGWLSSEILTETLSKFTGDLTEEQLKSMGYTEKQIEDIQKLGKTANDAATKVKTFSQLWDTMKEAAQSGWSQSWEIIIGDFEEAKTFLTEVSDTLGKIIGESAEARNKLLQGWKDAGGRNALLESLRNVFEGVSSIIEPIKEAFREIFPPMTVKQLVAFTEGLKNLTEKLKISDKTSENLKRTFKGLFAVVDIARQIFVAVVKAVGSLFGTVSDLGGGVLGVTAKIGDWLVKLNEAIKKSDIFNKGLQGVVFVIKNAISAISKFGSWIKEHIIKPLFNVGDAADEMRTSVSDAFDAMGSALKNSGFFKILSGLWKGVNILVIGIGKAIATLSGKIGDKIANADFGGIMGFINGIISGGIGIALIKFIDSLKGIFDGAGDFVENFSDIFGGVGDVLDGFQQKLKAEALVKIATAIAILAASLVVISWIDKDKLMDSLAALTVLFGELMLGMKLFTKLGELSGVTKACATMISMSVAILILSAALKTISNLSVGEMFTGLAGVLGLMAILVGAVKVLQSSEKTFLKGATQMILFAAAVKILASACIDLSYLSWEDLFKGFLGVAMILEYLQLFTKSIKNPSGLISVGIGLIAVGAAVKILASACADLAYLSWGDLLKGFLGVAMILEYLQLFTKTIKNPSGLVSAGVGLIAIAAAMKILASATQDLASMSWGSLLRGLLGLAGGLLAVVALLKLMPANTVSLGIGLIGIATAILIMSNALNSMGGMSWEEIGKGLLTLGASLAILTIGLKAMAGSMQGSAALIVAALALSIFTPVLLSLGLLSWSTIAKGLITIAGAFAVLGVAGYLLTPVIQPILALSGALALIGIGALALGAGLSAIAVGITLLAGSLGALVDIIIGVIVGIVKGIGQAIVAFCEVIIDGIPAIAEAIIAIVLAVCAVLVECAPVIIDTVMVLIVTLLKALAEYTPQIVDYLFDFLIAIIEGLARNLPRIIQAVVDVVMSIFSGVADAIASIDMSTLLEGIMGLGFLTAILLALGALVPLLPAAMAGVLGLGVVIGELALVLAAIGGLAQIPGLSWLVEEGGELMLNIGKAIGKFVGGILGGIAEGLISSLPQIGLDLAEFMVNLQPFIDGAKLIDSSVTDGVRSLIDIITSLIETNIFKNLTSWLSGGVSLSEFGEEIAAFGPGLKSFADSVAGIDAKSVNAAISAAQAIANMANTIPNEGGMVAWFTGENSISKFGGDLKALGKGLKDFSDSVVGLAPDSVVAAANAAKVIAEMANVIPNQGGMTAWFTGDNSLSKFSSDIVKLGEGLKGFSDSITGIVPENIVSAVEAAKVLAEMTNNIPNQGGMAAWFAGENSVSDFSSDIVELGKGLKGFSDSITGIVPENIVSAVEAAKVLAEMTNTLPNSGGMVSWFTGDNSVSKFGNELPALGRGLKGFSDAVVGIVPEAVMAAANAGKTLAEMTNTLPNSGGMVSWFTGDNSVSKFGNELLALGNGLKGFSTSVTGIAPENVTAAANAAKTLAEMTSILPNQGGMVSWFAGEVSMAKFSNELVKVGEGIKGFSEASAGIVPENVTAAANAAKALAEMANVVPNEGGMVSWFTGENSIATFAEKLPTLGSGLKGFSDSVAGISAEAVTAGTNAAKSLADMANSIPGDTSKMVKFGDNLKKFGGSLKAYFSGTNSLSEGAIQASNNAISAIENAVKLDSSRIKSTADAIDKLVDSIKGMGKITMSTSAEFTKALSEMGKKGADALLKSFEDVEPKMKKAAQKLMDAFIDGIDGKVSSAKSACKDMVSECASAIGEKKSSFKTAGKDLVDGFASGITANAFKAQATAMAMAKAALEAAKAALGIASPSKEFYEIGDYSGLGFVNALGDYASKTYAAASEMGMSARSGLNDAVGRLRDVIGGDMDVQPTIRPVLDLSNVRSGANAISNMFGMGSSIGVLSDIGTVNAMMNQRIQNGANSEVVSAIDRLRKDLGEMDRASYNINGVTYDDGSNITEAVKTIVRAAKVERRI